MRPYLKILYFIGFLAILNLSYVLQYIGLIFIYRLVGQNFVGDWNGVFVITTLGLIALQVFFNVISILRFMEKK